MNRRNSPVRARVGLESLEGRALMAGVFTEIKLPARGPQAQFVQVHDIAVAGDDQVALATTQYGQADASGRPTYAGTSIYRASSAGTLTAVGADADASRSAIYSLVPGPDGNLWGIVGYAPAKLAADGTITRFALPAGSYAQAIAPGPDGALWFTEAYHGLTGSTTAAMAPGAIGRITTSGQITQYPLPLDGAKPDQIVAGPDRAMWFTMNDFGNGAAVPKIGRITNIGAFTSYVVPTATTLPHAITLGPDGNLWYAAQGIARNSTPAADTGRNFIGRITPAGTFTEFALPAQVERQKAGFVLGGITAGPDGAVWFAEPKSGQIGRIDAAGTVTEFLVPTPDSAPTDITLGRDGALWFTELLGNKVGRYLPGPDLSAVVTAPAAAAGSVFRGAVASFTDATPGAAASYSAMIDWGDGTPATPGTLTSNGGRFDLVGEHAYARPGTYPLSVSVRQPSGEVAAASGTIAVRQPRAVSAKVAVRKRKPARIALSYEAAIDAAIAQDFRRYKLVSLGRDKKPGTRDDRVVRVRLATYDAATRTVYLTPRGLLPRRFPLQVTIRDEGALTFKG